MQKDSGDDPDITNGILVSAAVSKIASGIVIEGGAGVGRVKKPVLDQPVGEAAINSTPRRMIFEALTETAKKYAYTGGFRVVISVPEGERLAQRTFNPRMGITGGISIIGTTGIVEPMSNAAIVETVRTEANMRRAAGQKTLLLTLGNYSETFLKTHLPERAADAVMCSNFIGDALDIGVSLSFSGILLIGHIGKLVKLGSGIMQTHSAYADGRMETLIACAALAGVPREILVQITDCVTTDAALEFLLRGGHAQDALQILAACAGMYLEARVKGQAAVGAVMFSDRHDLILNTAQADLLLSALRNES